MDPVTIDKSQITLIAACVAACASLLVIIIKVRTAYGTEQREAIRETLTPSIISLSSSLYQVVAISAILRKNKSAESTENWSVKGKEASDTLERLAKELRYPLWGITEAMHKLGHLPNWIKHSKPYPETSQRLVKRGTSLRLALDRTIKNCFSKGRLPIPLEQIFVAWHLNALTCEYRSFIESMKKTGEEIESESEEENI